MSLDLQALESVIGRPFQNRDLLIRAVTHRSHASERRSAGDPVRDNEQLEFLGDAVLGFVVSEWLLERHPDLTEGKLSVARAALVSSAHLQGIARTLGLGEFLQLGRSEEIGGGRAKNRLLANALEAVIAAVYLDAGIDAARSFILERVVGDLDARAVEGDGHINYKGPLQERVQRLGLPQPRYSIVSSSGPEHAKRFVVEARVGNRLVSQGHGTSKKEAGQDAARVMLDQLDEPQPLEP
jgi:ribonuclease-3